MGHFTAIHTITLDRRHLEHLAGIHRHRYAIGDQMGAAVRALWPWMPRGNPYKRLLNS
jgi:hypothetical protein